MSQPGSRQRAVEVTVLVVLVTAFIGFLAGTRDLEPPSATAAVLPPAEPELASAPSYRQVRAGAIRAEARTDGLRDHEVPAEAGVEPVLEAELEARPEALAARARLRAYDGAPPVIPHPVDQGGALACTSCHVDGLVVGGKPVPKMSHELLTNCTQCHVPAERPLPTGAPALPWHAEASAFEPLRVAGGGDRTWPGAPPVVPHPTVMRNDCTSCHGGGGRLGMRSTHPWRQSCLQCHAPSAALDQQPMPLGPGPERP